VESSRDECKRRSSEIKRRDDPTDEMAVRPKELVQYKPKSGFRTAETMRLQAVM